MASTVEVVPGGAAATTTTATASASAAVGVAASKANVVAEEEMKKVKAAIAEKSGKDVAAFRNYSDNLQTELVAGHYKAMRSNQTLDYVNRMIKKWGSFNNAQMTIREAFDVLSDYVDRSDPDITLPNKIHAMQTAQAMRAAGEPEWMILTGLLHDMGKIMFAWGSKEDGEEGGQEGEQWGLGGDTWVVGVEIPDSVVMPEFNKLSPDAGKYPAPLGIYKAKTGLANLKFAFGHDEYMYMMLKHNKCTLPEEAFAMIRYHSCYPLHDKKEYKELLADGDEKLLEWVTRFNTYDLYTKCQLVPTFDELWPYYQGLIDKYCPGKLSW